MINKIRNFLIKFVPFFKVFLKRITIVFLKKRVVVVFSGGKTGTTFNIISKLIDRKFSVVVLTDKKKLFEAALASKIVLVDYECFDINFVCKELENYKIEGVLTGCGEHYLTASSNLAERLGVRSIGINSAEVSNNKSLISQRLQTINSKCSLNVKEHLNYIKSYNHKCVIKPVDGAGNSGVKVFNSGVEALSYYEKALCLDKQYIFEEFVEGDQFDVEGISIDGKHFPFSVTLEKYLSDNNGVVHTHWFLFDPLIHDKLRNKLFGYTSTFLNEVNVINGAWHLEVKVDFKEELFWIDFGNRTGGSFEYTLEEVFGYPFLDNYINSMVGDHLLPIRNNKIKKLRIYPRSREEFIKLTCLSKSFKVVLVVLSYPVMDNYGCLEFESKEGRILYDLLHVYYKELHKSESDTVFNKALFEYR